MPTATPRPDYPIGVPCWIDLEPPDIDAAAAFYGAVFGWSFEDRLPPGAPGRYVVATIDGLTVAALGSPTDGGGPGWNTYVAVEDAARSFQLAGDAGATLLGAPQAAGPAGTSAVIADPSGAEIRLWQQGRTRGAQLVNAAGSWNWSNLHTPDPAAVETFYSGLFGWELAKVDAGGPEYTRMWTRPGFGAYLASTVYPDILDDQATAGAPPGFADAVAWLIEDDRPRWEVTFTVDDVDAAASLIADHGGTVITQPYDQGPTRIAVAHDDQGSQFRVNSFHPERLRPPS
jgi:predicted enzyme related to lactoylglutathione lyase